MSLSFLSGCGGYRPPEPRPVRIVRLAARTQVKMSPVSGEILKMNPRRKTVGLEPVGKDWKMGQVVEKVWSHMPQLMAYLYDSEGRLARVVLVEGGYRIPSPLTHAEYTVTNGMISGPAAVWYGKEQLLLRTETWRRDKLNGMKRWYDEKSKEIAACEYREGEPWTGRMIERYRWEPLRWEVDYLDGKHHGVMRSWSEKGVLKDESTFRLGKREGLQKQYHEDGAFSESHIVAGIVRHDISYYRNGQLARDGYHDAKGRHHGLRVHYDEAGRLLEEQNYWHGKRHGRWLWSRGDERWYWHGEWCKNRAEFEAREAGG
jgi:antitoxin component YwqK of YwqJK toxin-antitoxin module